MNSYGGAIGMLNGLLSPNSLPGSEDDKYTNKAGLVSLNYEAGKTYRFVYTPGKCVALFSFPLYLFQSFFVKG